MTFVPEDILRLRLPATPTLRSDGRVAVAAIEAVTPGGSGYGAILWRFSSKGEGSPLIAEGPHRRQAQPKFGLKGDTLAFLSGEDELRELWCCSSTGERLECLASFDGEIKAFDWTPTGSLVAVVHVPVPADPDEPQVVSWLRYKSDGSVIAPYGRSEVWVIHPSGERALLARHPEMISLLVTNGRYTAYAVEGRRPDGVYEQSEVRLVEDDGSDELLWRCPSKIMALAIAPTTDRVVVAASGTPTHGVVPVQLWRIDGPGKPEPAIDLEIEVGYAVCGDTRPRATPSIVHFLPGDEVLFAATSRGEVGLWRASLATGVANRLTPEGTSLTDMSPPRGGQVAVCLERCDTPCELHLVSLPPSHTSGRRSSERPSDSVLEAATRQVSSLNSAWIGRRDTAIPQMLEIPRSDGGSIPALLYPAAGVSSAHPGPLLVRVHGGPHLCYGSAFDLETQIEVAAGFSVLLPNLRGSAGYGRAFREASVGEWGGKDYAELMDCVEFATDRDEIDPHRVYLAGGSYGGYLTNWAVTQTGYFRAAISERSVSNLVSKYGTADNGFATNREEMGGLDLFDDGIIELFRRSPLHYADRVTTPLLLIHGEQDQRCPIEQAEQFFVALRRLGKEVSFARFPGESHGLPYRGRPSRRISRLHLILSWLSEH